MDDLEVTARLIENILGQPGTRHLGNVQEGGCKVSTVYWIFQGLAVSLTSMGKVDGGVVYDIPGATARVMYSMKATVKGGGDLIHVNYLRRLPPDLTEQFCKVIKTYLKERI